MHCSESPDCPTRNSSICTTTGRSYLLNRTTYSLDREAEANAAASIVLMSRNLTVFAGGLSAQRAKTVVPATMGYDSRLLVQQGSNSLEQNLNLPLVPSSQKLSKLPALENTRVEQ